MDRLDSPPQEAVRKKGSEDRRRPGYVFPLSRERLYQLAAHFSEETSEALSK